jgi:hypothetical protein
MINDANWFSAGGIDSYQGKAYAQPGYGQRLTDTLAGLDAVLLPFSYNGAKFPQKQSNPQNPLFVVNSYDSSTPGNTDPQAAADTLEQEIHSVQNIWPNAKVFVIGHSNGGLVDEFWWIDHGRHHSRNVSHIWSLDSPINGVANVGALSLGFGAPFGVGSAVADFYTALWQNQVAFDPQFIAVADSVFTPVGTSGDPIYDAGDLGSSNGIISQVYFNEPACVNSGFDYPSTCKPQGTSVVSPCPVPSDTGLPPGNLKWHNLVKNCPGVISMIANVIQSS